MANTRYVRIGGAVVAVLGLLLVPTACGSAPADGPPTAAQESPAQGAAPAGPPDVAAQIEGMRRLAFMIGRWEGSGYFVGRDGRTDFTQTEVVAYRLDGALIAVDGDGRDAADPNRAIHSAFAVATYDPGADTFRWEAFSDGNRLETELQVSENRWQWGFQPVPQVTVRYTADFTATEWRELGEISMDGGATWTTNLEMTLTRVE